MKILSFLPFLVLAPFLSSCNRGYKIEGTTSVNRLDGRMLYLKTIEAGRWIDLDSAEIIHGSFKMKGKVDSVQMVSLYIGNEYIMPLVLEHGTVKVNIADTQLSAKGTELNDALYEFINKKNSLDTKMIELSDKEMQLLMDGVDMDEVHARLAKENDSLLEERTRYIKNFIKSNYENVLGPNIFMMICSSSFPYPVMTPELEDIIKGAPSSFMSNRMVKEYLSKARENAQLLEEHQRMQENEMMQAVESAHTMSSFATTAQTGLN